MLILLVLLGLTFWLIYKYWTFPYNYWKSRGFPVLPASFPLGSDANLILFRIFQGHTIEKLYNDCGKNRYIGIFTVRRPWLLIKDPDILQLVLVKDFSHFRDRNAFHLPDADILQQHLVNLGGDKWKTLRIKLSPVFSTGKLRGMFPSFLQCSEVMEKMLETKVGSEIDIRELTANYTIAVICSTAFGLDTNATSEVNAEFRTIGTASTGIDFRLVMLMFTSDKVENYIMNLVRSTIEYRQKNGIKRNDFMDLLIQLKEKGTIAGEEKSDEEYAPQPIEMTIELLAAQCFVFLLAGFETSSLVQSFCFYELAINPEIQKKLQTEIDTVIQHHGKLTYQALKEMTYLDMVISEASRKYPTLPLLQRCCTKDYTLPDGKVIEAGTEIVVPVWALHHDENFFPNPKKFDPERFSEEHKNIKPFTYLPFGEGPRMCIGMRFAQIQTKLGVVTLLRNYSIEPSKSTKIPMEFSASSFFTGPKECIKLRIVSRSL